MTVAASLPSARSLCVLPEAGHRQALLAHPAVRSLSNVLHVAPSLEAASPILHDGVEILVLSGSPPLASLSALASRWPAPEVVISTELSTAAVRSVFPNALILEEPLEVGAIVRSIEFALCWLLPLKRSLIALVGHLGLKDVQQFARLVMVREALSRTSYNRCSAARLLRVTRPAVQQMVTNLGLRELSEDTLSRAKVRSGRSRAAQLACDIVDPAAVPAE